MIEVAYSREKRLLKDIPKEVQEAIIRVLKILDAEYGLDRDQYKDNRGYVIIIEQQEDFQYVLDISYIDCNIIISEYVDKILCSSGEIYTNSMILCNNDYAISIIIPIELTPQLKILHD